jgi:class 3 adenylate cyclase
MIEFRSIVDAVRCAIEVQTRMVERNAGLAPERMKFRTVHVAARSQAKTTYFGPPVCPVAGQRRGSNDRREEGSEQWII